MAQGLLKSQGESDEWEGQGESVSDGRASMYGDSEPKGNLAGPKWRVKRSVSFTFVNQDLSSHLALTIQTQEMFME